MICVYAIRSLDRNFPINTYLLCRHFTAFVFTECSLPIYAILLNVFAVLCIRHRCTWVKDWTSACGALFNASVSWKRSCTFWVLTHRRVVQFIVKLLTDWLCFCTVLTTLRCTDSANLTIDSVRHGHSLVVGAALMQRVRYVRPYIGLYWVTTLPSSQWPRYIGADASAGAEYKTRLRGTLSVTYWIGESKETKCEVA